MGVELNVRAVAVKVTSAAVLPVPLSVTVCVAPGSVRVAVRLPEAVGVKLTTMAQLAEGTSVVLQVVEEMAKSPALAPLKAGACSVAVVPPVLDTVMV